MIKWLFILCLLFEFSCREKNALHNSGLAGTEYSAKGELLYKGAARAGLDKDEKTMLGLEKIQTQYLGQKYLEFLSSRDVFVTVKEVEDYYRKNIKSFTRPGPAAKICQVFSVNRLDAETFVGLLSRAASNEDRLGLFKERGISPTYVFKNKLIDDIENVVFQKSNQRLHGPIKSKFGYHIVFVVERYPDRFVQPLDMVYDEIYQRLYQRKYSLKSIQVLDSLTKQVL